MHKLFRFYVINFFSDSSENSPRVLRARERRRIF